MKDRKCSVLLAALPLAALLLTPLLGCDQPRRYSRSSRYYNDQNADYQRQLAADQRRRHIAEEQRHLDAERRQDRERSYDGRRY
jgi:hypothetical protein